MVIIAIILIVSRYTGLPNGQTSGRKNVYTAQTKHRTLIQNTDCNDGKEL